MRSEVGLIILILLVVFGFILGVCEAGDNYDKGGCKYESIAAFFPSRALACELIRKRF